MLCIFSHGFGSNSTVVENHTIIVYFCICTKIFLTSLPVECDGDQREDRRCNRPVSNEIGRHAKFQAESPIGIQHVSKVRQTVK